MNSTITNLKEEISKSNDATLIKSFESIRQKVRVEIIPDMLDRWRTTESEELRHLIYNFMIDIKDENAVSYFFTALANDNFADLRGELTGMLWQSGLDVSKYMDELISLALLGEYMTTVEVSTVIENIDKEFDEKIIVDLGNRIQEAIDATDDEDTIRLLDNLKELVLNLPVA